MVEQPVGLVAEPVILASVVPPSATVVVELSLQQAVGCSGALRLLSVVAQLDQEPVLVVAYSQLEVVIVVAEVLAVIDLPLELAQ